MLRIFCSSIFFSDHMHFSYLFQVKHIRGILFDDAEKSRRGSGGGQSNSGNKSSSIHLEINPVQVIQIQENPTKTVIASASGSNKKSTSKVSQDDSVLNYKVSSRDLSNRGGIGNK